jgi:phage-related protein
MTNNRESRLDQIERLLADVAVRTADNTNAIANNTSAIADNTNAINGLIAVTARMQEDFSTFITVVGNMQADIRGLQTESLRIQQRLEEYIIQTNRRLERLESGEDRA